MPGGKSCMKQDVFQETTAGKPLAAVANINNSLLIDSRVTPDTDMPSCTPGWCSMEGDNGMDIYSQAALRKR